MLVDDEPNVPNALKRGLVGKYEFLSATSAAEALNILAQTPNFAVIVADMSMPTMNGTDFLREAMKVQPDAIRVMLTGLADQKTAVKAINDGAIYRFLQKPCSIDEFERALNECSVKRQLQQQERELLQNTLGGVIGMVTDLLSFIDPHGVQLASATRKVVRDLYRGTSLPLLELELSALFENLGRLSLPLDLLTKISSQLAISGKEQELVDRSVGIGAKLLKQIPRLDRVAIILEALASSPPSDSRTTKLHVIAFTVAKKIARSASPAESSLDTLKRILPHLSDTERVFVTELLKEVLNGPKAKPPDRYEISVAELYPGHRLLEDIVDLNGKLLLKGGFMISEAVISRIQNHQELVGLKLPIVVSERIPTRA